MGKIPTQNLNHQEIKEANKDYVFNTKWWPTMKPWVNGGATGMIKTLPGVLLFSGAYYSTPFVWRFRHGQEKAAHLTKQLHNNQKYNALLKRIPIEMFPEATHIAARLGSFEVLKRQAVAANDGMPLSLHQEACCGLAAGAIGACVSTPTHLSCAYMKADAALPAAQRLNYKHEYHALYRMVANEGLSALWKGGGPHAKSSMAFDLGMLTSYNRSINYFKESHGYGEVGSRLGACMVSQFFATACSLAYTYVIVQTRKTNANEKHPYSRSLDNSYMAVKSQGPSLYLRAFPKIFAFNTPRVAGIWIIWELIQKLEESKGL